jgi:hypothetical protein
VIDRYDVPGLQCLGTPLWKRDRPRLPCTFARRMTINAAALFVHYIGRNRQDFAHTSGVVL